MDDAQKRKFGEGQLLLAMMANFADATGERNPIIGIILSPQTPPSALTVHFSLYTSSLHVDLQNACAICTMY